MVKMKNKILVVPKGRLCSKRFYSEMTKKYNLSYREFVLIMKKLNLKSGRVNYENKTTP